MEESPLLCGNLECHRVANYYLLIHDERDVTLPLCVDHFRELWGAERETALECGLPGRLFVLIFDIDLYLYIIEFLSEGFR